MRLIQPRRFEEAALAERTIPPLGLAGSPIPQTRVRPHRPSPAPNTPPCHATLSWGTSNVLS